MFCPYAFCLFFLTALKDVFVVGAKRTPFGSYGGKLMKYSATDLEEISMRSALESANINPEIVNSVHVGNVNQVTVLYLNTPNKKR